MSRPKTPFHPRTSQKNVTPWWYGWNGYLVPDVYTDPVAELRAIRTTAAVIDMSPLPKYEATGPDSPAFVDWLITRDAKQLPIGNLLYTPLCNVAGNMVSDGIVLRLDETVFRLTLDSCYQWLTQQASSYEVQIEDIIGRYGLLALQGPSSRAILADAIGQSWDELAFMRCRSTRIGKARVDLARTGFTGELGYELWVRAEDAPGLWDAIFQAGEAYGLLPAGEYAIDMARVEAGLIVITADYTGCGPDTRSAEVPLPVEHPASPYELGLGHLIDFSKPAFIGKEALMVAREREPEKRLVGLEFDWAQVAAHYIARGLPPEVSSRVRWDVLPVQSDGHEIGWATSVTWSPTINKLIGFGRVASGVAGPGAHFTVRWPVGDDAVPVNAKTVTLPFVRHTRA